MRILAINRFYKPDHSATAQLLADLAEHLAREGCEVTVVASRLRYEGGDRLPARERLAGVSVLRIWTTQFGRAGLVGRSLDYFTFYASAFFTTLIHGRRGDILIAKTDPPLISVVAALAAQLKGMVLINWCQDLFPEIAGALGIRWAKGWPGGLLRRLRNWSLNRASFNAVLHERMAERLREQGVSDDKIRVLPNWAPASLRPVPHAANPLRQEWGLKGRYVIAYSGNLGRAHMPEKVAQLVRETLDIDRLTWLFIGGGAGLKAVKDAAGSAPNVLFKPYQPLSRLSESLSAADAHLIALDPDCEGYIVPSKLYGVQAVARPVLFLGALDGAVARDIAGDRAGQVLEAESASLWPVQIEMHLAQSPLAPRFAAPDAARALGAWRAELARATVPAAPGRVPQPAA